MLPMQATRQTIELRDLIASGVDIWAFDYPSYYKDEAKAAFEKKVIDHFYFRQIGAETPGRFLHYFRRTVREIMPLYIQRYESVDMMKDPTIRPLDNYNMIEEFSEINSESREESASSSTADSSESTHEASGSSEKHGNDAHATAEQDTPQGEMIWEPGSKIENVSATYASRVTQDAAKSDATENTSANEYSESTGGSESESSGTASSSGETTHTLTRRGNIGVTTYSQLLEGYRQTFLNIDMEIIKDLEICFLGVY